jgi:cobalt-zinc-cadmium efflux system protein
MSEVYPAAIVDGIARGRMLEYWTLAWIATVIPLMYIVMGSSQAMKTVWIEDILGFVPPLAYLLSQRLERKAPTEAYPYGFARVNSVAFVVSSVALAMMGVYLLVEAIMTLVQAEHPTVGTTRLFGRDIWLGWPMIAVLLWSTIPSMILGRLKLPVAKTINDKVLHTDADMQKADWMTGIAAIGGIIGIGFGLWWADAAAAGFISLGILHDGISDLRSSTAELVDGAPRNLEDVHLSDEAKDLKKRLETEYPGSAVLLRETGRLIRAQVRGSTVAEAPPLASLWPGEQDRAWRFAELSFVPDSQRP